MRISAIQNYHPSYNKQNGSKVKSHQNIAFGKEYEDKPVPQAGKNVAKVAVATLFAAMLYSAYSNKNSLEYEEPLADSTDAGYFYPDIYHEKKAAQTPQAKAVNNEPEPQEQEVVEDSADVDTAEAVHNEDSALKEIKARKNINVNGQVYELINSGDTVVLVPKKHSGHKDSIFHE